MKRAFAIAAVVELLFVLILLHSNIKDFLWTHPWWHSFLAALPTIALPVLAYLEWRDSAEMGRLQIDLDTERNRHLGQIAKNTAGPVTQAERNAEILRRHLGAKVTVTEGPGSWGNNTPEIVEVVDDIVTLFVPRNYSSSTAWCVRVHCGDLEITEIPQGSCPLRLKVLKRYGPDVQLGEITQWKDRSQPMAEPKFSKGATGCFAQYAKPGTSERRSIGVFEASDGANSFLLEASTGERMTGNNQEISKRFLALQVEYEAAGFARNSFGSGNSRNGLFVR